MGDVLNRPAAPPDDTVRYGPGPEHVASVWRPRFGALGTAPVVMFLHGGFWRATYDRTHVGPLAVALAEAGFLVCAPEYRRTGGSAAAGGGWPATFDDIAAAMDVLPGVVSDLGGPPPSAGLLPIGVPLRVLHGSLDDVVPAAMSRSFADRARAAGDEVNWRELAGQDHFDLIDPESVAWGTVRGAFGSLAR
jgi:acetyl esterase/lipase